jgi:hypothetical protein
VDKMGKMCIMENPLGGKNEQNKKKIQQGV